MTLDEAAVRATLLRVLDRAPPIEFRLVGTAASLLHGVELPALDVDVLLRRRSDVDRFAAACAQFRTLFAPAYLAEARQYFARHDVAGVVVEFSTVEGRTDSDSIECVGPGPWIHYSLVDVGSYQVAIVSPELRLVSELTRGRRDRYEPILRRLATTSCDLALIERGMDERRLNTSLRGEVRRALGAA